MATDVSQTAAADSTSALATPGEPQELMSAEGDTALPEQVAFVPTMKPTAAGAAAELEVAAPDGATTIAGTTPQALTEVAEKPAQAPDGVTADSGVPKAVDTPAIPTEKPVMDNPVYVTAGPGPQQPIAPKKKGFLAALFGSSPSRAAPAPAAPQPLIDKDEPAHPVVTLASAETNTKPLALTSTGSGQGWSTEALPGVRQSALFEITRKSGLDDDSDVDINEGSDSYQVASAAGMARLAPNGLLKQTTSVDVACLKPALVRVLKTIEAHYGKKLIVTSGYRDPNRNRRARGARNSLHMYCAAADIQVPGVSKWDLANYARSMPGRGGVGTYCHTNSVHVDVGPERDWNWRCRRRK
jgi:uncharacterized protein YcbK (DUF882 family)